MNINSIADFRAAIRQGPYAWPGGYSVYFEMADGEAMSFKAVKAERRRVLEALRDCPKGYRDFDWLPLATDINWEDTELTCAHTGEKIPSAYGAD
jgi:hypothetical protein